jgi:peroxiredoxin Q/BCP
MKFLNLIISILMFSSAAIAQVEVGDKAPSFELLDQNGKSFTSNDVIGREIVVIYFYPKDDTPGCTKEACSFRDNFEAFTDAGVQVIGVSADDVQSHKKFADKYKLPYTLLSDTENKVRKLFGVKGDLFGLIPGRVTFVVDKNGVVRHVFNSQMNAEKHITESLAAIEKLKNE